MAQSHSSSGQCRITKHSKFHWNGLDPRKFSFDKWMQIEIVVNDITNHCYWLFCSCNHHVNAVSDEPMSQGNRVYVFGSLSSKPFSLDDGRLRYSLIIKSKYLRLRSHEHNMQSKTKDVNNVKILAKISTDIHHTNDHTLFTLVSSHTPKYWTYLFPLAFLYIYSNTKTSIVTEERVEFQDCRWLSSIQSLFMIRPFVN